LLTGTITVAQDPAACSVDIKIDTASISTQNTERDEDLRSPAFFDVKKFPAMTYQGRGVRRASGNSWTMDGALTIRGVTKMVPLTFTFKGLFPDTPPGEPARAAFHASAATKRGDFGMTRDNLMELGASPTGRPDVAIEIDVEADAKVDLPSQIIILKERQTMHKLSQFAAATLLGLLLLSNGAPAQNASSIDSQNAMLPQLRQPHPKPIGQSTKSTRASGLAWRTS
jgi:polyisoprenoid-binding protein YceI